MKVSFDFDGTLQTEEVQLYAEQLIQKGVEVWVTTTRWDENHKHKYEDNPTLDDLWEVVDRLGIPRHQVRFTNMQWKYTYLTGTHFHWHLDDNESEITKARINECNVPMIQVGQSTWKQKCEQLLNNTDDDI